MSRRAIRLIALIVFFVFSLSLLSGCPISILRDEEEEETEVSETVLVTETTEAPKIKIGVSMPTQRYQRWVQDGRNLQTKLQDAGYEVILQYADDDTYTQIEQIEGMITAECKVLVISPVHGRKLGTVLQSAQEEGIKVISFDRLILDTDACDYYATFDNYLVGTLQGKYIEDALDLPNAGDRVYNLEMFAGAPDDNNAMYFYRGAYDVLMKYIDSGTLNVRSGETDFEDIATEKWETENARIRMSELLSADYADGEIVHAVLSPNDSLALGISNALSEVGYQAGVDFPIITGQDCDRENIKNIIRGKQSMSVFKDTRDLTDAVVQMVKAIIEDKPVPVNDSENFDNGDIIVPTLLIGAHVVDASNYRERLIEPGYYSEEDLRVAGEGELSGELTIYTYTTEVSIHALAFQKQHPNVQIKIVTRSTTDGYFEQLKATLSQEAGPDVVALEAAFVKEAVEMDGLLSDLSDLRPEAEKIEMYPYVLGVGTDAKSGELRGLSFQFTPMMVYYRRSLAREYFGTDDPEKIQALLSNMDQFTKAAQTVHEKSSGKTYMIASFQDLERLFLGERSGPWVVNGKLNIDPEMQEYMTTSKTFVENGYSSSEKQWYLIWFGGLDDRVTDQSGSPMQVFCYILPPWGLSYLIPSNGQSTLGDWAAVPGPVQAAWGGTWLGVPENAQNKELAREFISFATLNEKALTDWATGVYTWEFLSEIDPVIAGDYYDNHIEQPAGDFVSSKKVAEALRDSFEFSVLNEYLGGQNCYEVFCEAASRDINANLVQPMDDGISFEFGECVYAYINGNLDKIDALKKFRDRVNTGFGIS